MYTLLSLFDYTGNWAAPYAEAGWNVVLWDKKHDPDMFQYFADLSEVDAEFMHDHIFDNYGTVEGVLAAPPCTDFSSSGAWKWKEKDDAGITQKSIDLVYKALAIVDLVKPYFWAFENPVGRMPKLVPELAAYGPWYFDPCDFGDPYTKKTGLWGCFSKPAKKRVEPIEGSKMHKQYGGKSERTKELRSVTPEGFSRAFYSVNSGPFENWFEF